MIGTLKWIRGRTFVFQGDKHQRSLAIRIEKAVRTEDRLANYILKRCLPLKTFPK